MQKPNNKINKLILIFSIESDYTTKLVLEWLKHFEKSYIVLKKNDRIKIENVIVDKNQYIANLIFNGLHFSSSEIWSVWFRKEAARVGDYFVFDANQDVNSTVRDGILRSITAVSYSKQEILNYLMNNVSNLKLGNNFQGSYDKITALFDAQKVGLKTPKTLVTSSKQQVEKFILSNKSHPIIVKSLAINFSCRERIENTIYTFMQYTSIMDNDFFKELPERFPLTLFQNFIEKEYEIRVLVIRETLFCQAYFTNLLESTKIDSRKYDKSRITPSVPYKLPDVIEKKILKLMQLTGLNTASIDLIKSKAGDFVFLEINPQGQFGGLSGWSNYYVEKHIAEIL